ncbi:TetR/AcrR family transcriptional regulator [Sphingomonas bacterium]|uniref:TetR/AcrR family transcriptional regulator n=1 Tax=Sphingomonas bacterium TaxID=1895847 RepID=UPI0015764037|nr:TetR/AcrR family transcriptional regulator [Sphingomonas bacterium]
MGVAERKKRERDDRERRITAAARQIATAEGWEAVTIRRLAEAIEYSQPVLYSHFANRDAIVAAVAVEGFRELADALQCAPEGHTDGRDAMRAVASAYLAFAWKQPAIYEAMFAMPTGLRFAEADAPPAARDAFAALAAVVPAGDVETATETFWAALHGLVELDRAGRIRPSAREERLTLAVNGLLGHEGYAVAVSTKD